MADRISYRLPLKDLGHEHVAPALNTDLACASKDTQNALPACYKAHFYNMPMTGGQTAIPSCDIRAVD